MQAEQRNQLIFVLREICIAARDIDMVLGIVDRHIARGKHTRICDRSRAVWCSGMTNSSTDSRKQFFRAEGLGQIIVRARVERLDLIALMAACRNDQNGNLRPFSDVSEDRHAVHIRQAEVEDDDIRTVRRDHGICHCACAGHEHIIAVCRQDCLHKSSDRPLILN